MPATTNYRVEWLGPNLQETERIINMFAGRGLKFVSMSWYPDGDCFVGVFTEVEGE